MQKRGFTLVELIAVTVVLGIIILLATSTLKNAGDRVKKEAYQNKVNLIKAKASEYASGTKVLVTNVDRLVKKGYLSADNENGDVINPIDGSRMNCKIVTMYKSEGNYYADYVEDETKEECDASKISYDNGYTSIEKHLLKAGGVVGEEIETGEWTREDNRLILKINDEEMVPIASIDKVEWSTNAEKKEKKGADKFTYDVQYSIVDTVVTATVYLKNEENGESNNEQTYTATTVVKIDKKRPWIDKKVVIENPNEWSNHGKEVRITAGDEGSGVKGYAVIKEEDWKNLPGSHKCESVKYEEKEENAYTTRLENGNYYVCVKDKAGNVSEDMSEPLFEIEKADVTPPKCEINLPLPTGKDGWYTTKEIEFKFSEDADGQESDPKKGSGIDTSQIFVDGKLYNESSYILKEDRSNFKVAINVTDKAGNVCHKEVTVNKDATAPTCEYGGESTTWTNDDRTIRLGCKDNLSGCAESYSWSKTYSWTVGEAHDFGSYTIRDKAGNTTVCNRKVDAYVDKNAPSCKIYVSGTVGANSWYTSDVAFDFEDGSAFEDKYESGVKTKTIKVNGVEQTGEDYTLNYDTSSFTVSISVTDYAGNTCSDSKTVKRDITPPSCSYSGESSTWTSENRTISLTCRDNLSGCVRTNIASKTYTGTTSNDAFGTYIITDRAGNSTTCNRSVSVKVDKCDSSTAVKGSWSACDKDCGGGKKKRSISYRSTTGSGFTCPVNGRKTSESTDCNTQACSSGGGGGGSCSNGYGCCTDAGQCQCCCNKDMVISTCCAC